MFCQFECTFFLLIPSSSQGFAYPPLVTLLQEPFWDQQQWIQCTEEKYWSPHSCPVHVPPFSPLSHDQCITEEPLDKTHHLCSGAVVQLVAWEPGCMAFCLFPMERGAAVKQQALLETVMSLLAPSHSPRHWLLLPLMVLPRLDQADCSGSCGRAMRRSKWLEDPFCQCMDWCVCFELTTRWEEQQDYIFFFPKTAVALHTGEVIMRKEPCYKIRIYIC